MIHDISVIIPIKDETELPYLVSLLDDICRQSDFKYRLEIIIVASDGVKKVIEQTYRLKDRFEYVPPISVRDLPANYVTTSRNWGATNSTGDVLLFLDVDNKLPLFFISDMTVPIITAEYIMTYSPPRYDDDLLWYRDTKQKEKDQKLIKYNNFLLRFEPIPKVPFAINKEVFRTLGGLKPKNPMFSLYSSLLLKWPGGVKKINTEVLVSARHVLERAKKKSK